jgi:hypothetical protein
MTETAGHKKYIVRAKTGNKAQLIRGSIGVLKDSTSWVSSEIVPDTLSARLVSIISVHNGEMLDEICV